MIHQGALIKVICVFFYCCILCFPSKAVSVDIQLTEGNGIHWIPVRLNGFLQLDFVLDSGASEISIPEQVFDRLSAVGKISQSDILPSAVVVLADGKQKSVRRFLLREIEVGGIVIRQLPAMIAEKNAPPLLGQSFLGRVESWSISNDSNRLTLKERKNTPLPMGIIDAMQFEIFSPKNNQSVQKIVYVSGKAFGLGANERSFLVVQSAASKFGRRIYPQALISPDALGSWSVRAIYASKGYEYLTYIVVASTEAAIDMLSSESSRRDGIGELPVGARHVGAVISVIRE